MLNELHIFQVIQDLRYEQAFLSTITHLPNILCAFIEINYWANLQGIIEKSY